MLAVSAFCSHQGYFCHMAVLSRNNIISISIEYGVVTKKLVLTGLLEFKEV